MNWEEWTTGREIHSLNMDFFTFLKGLHCDVFPGLLTQPKLTASARRLANYLAVHVKSVNHVKMSSNEPNRQWNLWHKWKSNHYKVLSNGYVTVCDTSSLAFDLLVWSPVTQGQKGLSSTTITSYLHFFHYAFFENGWFRGSRVERQEVTTFGKLSH